MSKPNSESELLEARWMRRVAQGDRDAFTALYDIYSKPLYAFALGMLNDHREAEDVIQEVFVLVWKRAASFDEAAGKPFCWMMTMTRNKAIDQLRSRKRRANLVGSAIEGVVSEECSEDSYPRAVFDGENAAQLRVAVDKLPNEQRHPIEMAFFNGLTHSEVAKALKEPLGTIKARIRRGMMRLRLSLEGRA